jgi:hypothetical protein
LGTFDDSAFSAAPTSFSFLLREGRPSAFFDEDGLETLALARKSSALAFSSGGTFLDRVVIVVRQGSVDAIPQIK